MSFAYDLSQVTSRFKQEDDLYAKAFLEDPATFEKRIATTTPLDALYLTTKIIYQPYRAIPLLGGLAMFSSSAYCPKSLPSNAIIPFKVASANGAFFIYENSCCSMPTEHFFKIGLQNADYMEVEAIAMRVMQRHVPRSLQRFFLTYRGSGNVVAYKDPLTKDIALDLGKYKSSEHTHSFFGQAITNNANSIIAPFIITRVAQGGLSLSQILQAWKYVNPTTDQHKLATLKQSMRLFHRSSIYERAVSNITLDDRLKSVARQRIYDKYEEFLGAVLSVAPSLKLSHADLHSGNILYDYATDNFVLIDYGRVTVDLEAKGVPIRDLLNEALKLKSLPHDFVTTKITSPNTVYSVYNNYGSRPFFDDSEVTKYGILLDLAPLSLFMLRQLKHRLSIEEHPIISYSEHTDFITVASLDDTIQYFTSITASPPSLVDLVTAYAALILRAALDADIITDYTYLVGTENTSAFTTDFKLLFGEDKHAIFYTYGQPDAEKYKQYKKFLEHLTNKVKYFDVLKAALLKKGMTGGQSQVSSEMPSSKANKVNLVHLTQANYEFNMLENAKMSTVAKQRCDDQSPKHSASIPYAFDISVKDSTPIAELSSPLKKVAQRQGRK